MIPIETGPEPEILTENGKEWGEEYKQAKADGAEAPERYRRDDIKEALRLETHGKCAYCESAIEHISYAHIEHIIPKSVVPELVCYWKNLTLACERCNLAKGTYYSANAPLLNPYMDDITNALTFFGPMAFKRTDQAKLTISKVKLNRADLLFRRQSKLEDIANLIELIAKSDGNEAVREALYEDLKDRLSEAAEYTSCSRCFAKDVAADRKIQLPYFDGGAEPQAAELQ